MLKYCFKVTFNVSFNIILLFKIMNSCIDMFLIRRLETTIKQKDRFRCKAMGFSCPPAIIVVTPIRWTKICMASIPSLTRSSIDCDIYFSAIF